MKIVIVNTHFVDQIGGSQLQCDLIAEELHKRGYNVTYLAIEKESKYERNYNVLGVARDSSSIAKKLLELNPDIVYWRFNKKYFYKSVKALSTKKAKIIFAVSNVRDVRPYNTTWRHKFTVSNLIRYILRNVVSRYNHMGFKYVDALTVNNQEQLEMVDIPLKWYIPNAIITEKKDFQWEKPFVLWVANLKNRKRPELFVELARRFEKSKIDFLMIGKLSDDSYEWIADKDKTPVNLHYLGAKEVKIVNGAMAQSLFLVTTSTPEEGFSNNIIQAWMQKKTVIAFEFDPGGMIEKHNIGYIARGNFEKLVEQTKSLIENGELRMETGERAYKVASNHFSTEKTVNKLESLFKKVMQK